MRRWIDTLVCTCLLNRNEDKVSFIHKDSTHASQNILNPMKQQWAARRRWHVGKTNSRILLINPTVSEVGGNQINSVWQIQTTTQTSRKLLAKCAEMTCSRLVLLASIRRYRVWIHLARPWTNYTKLQRHLHAYQLKTLSAKKLMQIISNHWYMFPATHYMELKMGTMASEIFRQNFVRQTS